ncbi:T9SS type A sorting domain-containing protein [candidate division KSB1 bacterium]|nr:T9SS type A sorting domain-containing protein [candidate division KSB1 bacterium]
MQIKIHQKFVLIVALLILSLLFPPTKAVGQMSSTNYKIQKDVQDEAGAPSNSAGYKVLDAIGQPSDTEPASSANFQLFPGFLAEPAAPAVLPLLHPVSPPTAIGSIGTEFDVYVEIQNVTDLFGISFVLEFNTTYLEAVSENAESWFGTDLVFLGQHDNGAGTVNIGGSRKSGQGGVNGTGNVAKVRFRVKADVTTDTNVDFNLSAVAANNSVGGEILLQKNSSTTILQKGGLIVWPGDTNDPFDPLNVVNQADVLPIGLHWGKTGPRRTCHAPAMEIMWMAHTATPWAPDQNATYADANGDGVINQADILAIGLNWGKTHTLALHKDIAPEITEAVADTPKIMLKFHGNRNPGNYFYIDVFVKKVNSLFGISFELSYTPRNFIRLSKSFVSNNDSLQSKANNLLEADAIYFPMIDSSRTDTMKLSIAISRKFGQAGITADSGLVTRIKAYMMPDAEKKKSTTKWLFKNVFANDPTGSMIDIKVDTSKLRLITDIEKRKMEFVPTEFTLLQSYPNPFNPETTIEYYLPEASEVTLSIYDMQGRLVQNLVSGDEVEGLHAIRWNGQDATGKNVASGVYFYQIQVKPKTSNQPAFSEIKKMMLMK